MSDPDDHRPDEPERADLDRPRNADGPSPWDPDRGAGADAPVPGNRGRDAPFAEEPEVPERAMGLTDPVDPSDDRG